MRETISQVFKSLKSLLPLLLLFSALSSADTAPAWSRVGTFAGSGDDSGNAVKVDKFGNRYVTGFFSSTANFDGSPLSSRGDTDVFLANHVANRASRAQGRAFVLAAEATLGQPLAALRCSHLPVVFGAALASAGK